MRVPPLRFITYLVPSLPRDFYEAVATRVASRLGREATLEVDMSRSGPIGDPENPFAHERTDVGFLCAPVFGTIALVLGIGARKKISTDPRYTGGGMALAGMILGIIWLALFVLGFFIKLAGVQ